MSKPKRGAKQMGFDTVKKQKRNKPHTTDKTPLVQKLLSPKNEETKGLADFENETAKLFSWNVNGIRAVIGRKQLQDFIKEYDPDVLCINETKVDPIAIEKQKLRQNIPSEYIQYWNCVEPPKKGYAGTAMFTKVKPISVTFDFESTGDEQHDKEGRTITAEFEKFFLVTSYVPNAGVGKLERLDYRVDSWDKDFHNYLRKLEKSGKPVVLCGDLNVAYGDIDVHNPKGLKKCAGFTDQERASFGKFLNNDESEENKNQSTDNNLSKFIDSFRHHHPEEQKFSFWSAKSKAAKAENRGWRLDYFITSQSLEENIEKAEIHSSVEGSDHCPIELTLKFDKKK